MRAFLLQQAVAVFLFALAGAPAVLASASQALAPVTPSTTNAAAAPVAPPRDVVDRKAAAAVPAGVIPFMHTGGKPPAIDGSMTGWENAPPISFALDDNKVEARCMYDEGNLYLRMHLRKGYEVDPTVVFDPIRMFTHENMRDEVSFYFQGNPSGVSGGEHGRAGDFRIVFSVVKEQDGSEKVYALGMFPHWGRPGAMPVEYWSPVRTENMQHVALVEGAQVAHATDPDRKGVVMAARIPAASVTIMAPLKPGLRTRADFSATIGGVTKFWWVNTGRMDATYTTDEPSEAKLFPGAWGPAWFLGP